MIVTEAEMWKLILQGILLICVGIGIGYLIRLFQGHRDIEQYQERLAKYSMKLAELQSWKAGLESAMAEGYADEHPEGDVVGS
ncbi:unnamed protein product [marine sediment metagenome]|uniref:Uncharacterized protein n=1 Tax=marine sediment metagenome TaxID=412755 RepID=X1BUI8_9ZZZZ